jgi:hypothetical protein
VGDFLSENQLIWYKYQQYVACDGGEKRLSPV